MAAPSGVLKVESKDPRINYNLLPGDELLTCPYNYSHALLPIKFSKHVLNCHRLHCKEQAKKGEPSLFAICQYDRSHHVRKELLAHHELECEARVRPGQHNADDDWGWDDGPSTSKVKSEASASEAQAWAPAQPPPLNQAALAKIHEEDWDALPIYPHQFDPEKRIRELRKNGYAVVKYPTPGLSKSEKREFYDHERKVMDGYSHMQFLKNVQQTNSSKSSKKSASSRFGSVSESEDGVLVPIREEGQEMSAKQKYTPKGK